MDIKKNTLPRRRVFAVETARPRSDRAGLRVGDEAAPAFLPGRVQVLPVNHVAGAGAVIEKRLHRSIRGRTDAELARALQRDGVVRQRHSQAQALGCVLAGVRIARETAALDRTRTIEDVTHRRIRRCRNDHHGRSSKDCCQYETLLHAGSSI